MSNVVTAEQLAQAITATRDNDRSNVMPQPSNLRVLALALEAYATWLERDPSTYDADALARELEKAGVVDHYEWAPSSWVIEAIHWLRINHVVG